MEEVKYKVSEVGIDTRGINYDFSFIHLYSKTINYLFTSIPENNDHIIGDYENRFNIITYIDTTERLEYLVESHIKALGVKYISILLFDSSCDLSRVEVDIKSLQTRGLVSEIGIYNPGTVEVLSNCKVPIEYVGLPVCPLDYNHEVMEWSRLNGKTIIGLDPFGDYLSTARNIESFTKVYLLNFISTNADIVILPSHRGISMAITDAKYVMSLSGRDSLPMYILKKSMHKSVEPLKKFAYTSLLLDDGIEVSYEEPEELIDGIEITLGAAKKTRFEDNTKNALDKFDVDEELEKEINPEKSINDLVTGILDYVGLSDDTAFAFARYRALERLKDFFPPDNWGILQARIGKSVVTFEAVKPESVKGMLWWAKVTPKESRTFVLAMNDRRFKFFEVNKNAPGIS